MNLKKIAQEALDEAGMTDICVDVAEAEDEAEEVKNLRSLLRTHLINKKDFSAGIAALAALGKISKGRVGILKRQMGICD